MGDTLGAVAALLPGVRIEAAGTLRRPERSEVLRVRAAGPGWSGPQMLIVKCSRTPARVRPARARHSRPRRAPGTAPGSGRRVSGGGGNDRCRDRAECRRCAPQ